MTETNPTEVFSCFMATMGKASSKIKAFLRAKLKDHNMDLTFEMLQVLNHLWDKDGVNQQELANLLHKDKASLTYLIDNLSKRELVQRTEDASDRRNKIIRLLPEGKRLEGIVRPWLCELSVAAGKEVPVALLQDGITLFSRIYSNLCQLED
ncbi:MarR family transcriptional regulator [Paraflavisolibacter sp. H34]|uniref:MarR family winged helix-turn-helix transcriptional regulator n=1 Tax=Huijunlia imazamoxiresistens TaxID=3127457 RepID=UPI00301967A2